MSAAPIPKHLVDEIDRCRFICGSDEVGYGSWAGKLTVCAAVVDTESSLPVAVDDSKALTPTRREAIYEKLVGLVTHCLVHVEVEEIDARGVGTVLMEAHSRAIQGALQANKANGGTIENTCVIIDGSRGVLGATALPGADSKIIAVSAASILAKVTRDRYMVAMAKLYPGYDFESNAGYHSQRHVEGLDRLGVCPIHRKSYEPIRKRLAQEQPRDMWADFEAADQG
jgi:ribonuclease HII